MAAANHPPKTPPRWPPHLRNELFRCVPPQTNLAVCSRLASARIRALRLKGDRNGRFRPAVRHIPRLSWSSLAPAPAPRTSDRGHKLAPSIFAGVEFTPAHNGIGRRLFDRHFVDGREQLAADHLAGYNLDPHASYRNQYGQDIGAPTLSFLSWKSLAIRVRRQSVRGCADGVGLTVFPRHSNLVWVNFVVVSDRQR
jgi:hypothetical protein